MTGERTGEQLMALKYVVLHLSRQLTRSIKRNPKHPDQQLINYPFSEMPDVK